MRIHFSPCGVGLGHVGRCLPIARRLHKIGAEILFSTYDEGVEFVREKEFPVVRTPPIGFVVKEDGTVDFRQTTADPGPFKASLTAMKQIDVEIQVMKAFKPDVVVSDSRASPVIAAKLLGIPVICILNQFQVIIPRRKRLLRLARIADAFTLTVIGKIWTAGTATLIPDFPEPYTLSIENLQIPTAYQKAIRFIGPILPLHPDELPHRRVLRKRLNLSEEKQVIFAPISGPLKERAYLIRVLRKILKGLPKDFQVVMSLGEPSSTESPRRNGKMTIYNWIPNRFEYLKACDLVIARAGHGTVTQSISYGKPIILIPTPNHTEQMNIARNTVRLGIGELLRQKDLDNETLLTTIHRVQLLQGRAKEIQNDVLQFNGLETATQTIRDMVQSRSR